MLQGRNAPAEAPSEVFEFFMACEFNWTLDYIRSLTPKDFHIMSTLITIKARINSTQIPK